MQTQNSMPSFFFFGGVVKCWCVYHIMRPFCASAGLNLLSCILYIYAYIYTRRWKHFYDGINNTIETYSPDVHRRSITNPRNCQFWGCCVYIFLTSRYVQPEYKWDEEQHWHAVFICTYRRSWMFRILFDIITRAQIYTPSINSMPMDEHSQWKMDPKLPSPKKPEIGLNSRGNLISMLYVHKTGQAF